MNTFMGTISGEFYRIINSESGIKHWSFFPNELTSMVSHFKIDVELTHILTRTHRLLGILEGTIRNLPDIEPFWYLGILCEAQKSCAVDGILVGIDGMFQVSKQAENDLAVSNYYNTLKNLKKVPVTAEVLCGINQTVMEGTTKKIYGSIRKSVFFMHPKIFSGSAEYNPPPPEYIPELLKDLEHFIKNESSIDILIKAAVVYYQFETIHPFECGNGRVGRILILLMLMNENVLCCPFLPIASSLLEEQDECRHQFVRIQYLGEFSEWITFFVNRVARSAENALQQIGKANKLRQMMIEDIKSYKKTTQTLMNLYNLVEKNPIINVDYASKMLGVAYNTASKNIGILQELGILEQGNDQSRYRQYHYDRLLRIFRFL